MAPSFAAGSADLLDYLELQVDAKQVERVAERIGAARVAERDAAVAEYMSLPLAERKGQPAAVAVPAVAAVFADGGRLQIRGGRMAGAAAAAGEDADAVPTPDDQHRGKHWRENKVGLCTPMTSVAQETDPCPEVPAAFVDPTRIAKLARELKTKKAATVASAAAAPATAPEQADEALRGHGTAAVWEPPQVQDKHLVATRRPWADFGPMLATQAWQLGFFQAPRQAFVGDGSDNVWAVWRRHFASFVAILDIIHAISYLFAAAMAGRPFAVGWPCYVRGMTWVWQGAVEKVIAELADRQAELGTPQDDDGDTHPRVVVSAALRYLQNHKDKMRYPEYRRQGLPITSSYVESAVKQFNQRVKGTEKFWTEAGAEALLQLRADSLGTITTVVDEFWQARQDNATGQNAYAMSA
jgi:hypothetical protein